MASRLILINWKTDLNVYTVYEIDLKQQNPNHGLLSKCLNISIIENLMIDWIMFLFTACLNNVLWSVKSYAGKGKKISHLIQLHAYP